MSNLNEKPLRKSNKTATEDCECRKSWFGMDNFCINCILGYIVAAVLFAAFIIFVAVSGGEGTGGIFAPVVTLGEGISDFLFTFKSLPVWIIMIPLIGGPIEALIGRRSENGRDMAVVNTTFATFFLILAMYPQVAEGTMRYAIPRMLGLGLSFKVDMLGFIMVLTSSVLWVLVSIYAHDYMAPEKHKNRFYMWMAVTYGGVLGTIMAGDLLTMFLFFEIMTFASYFLVAHNQTKESLSAGANYIYMGVAGGLCILLGMTLVYVYTGTVAFRPLAHMVNGLGAVKYLMAGLFITGFGIKAGMLPLHIWLPKAHPVAPTPASALLSGLMIKIGAFGILRVMTSFFMPAVGTFKDYKDPLWYMEKSLGAAIIWIGIMTMAVGVFMALQQSHMKKMLAYHSISQMGYIIMGIGVAAYLGPKGAMGFAGAVYHMVNHALFKALLFMVAGVIYLKTHEMDMYKLGGLWRKFPFTAAMCMIAILGITGMPLFNGFASKSILHHAIIEAYEYGSPVFRYAEIMFTIISAGTVCSFIKLFGFVFLGKLPERFEHIRGEKMMMNFGMGGLAVLIILIGEFPNFVLEKFIIPAASVFSYDPAFITKYLGHMNFFNQTDMMGMVYVYFIGAIIFYVGIRYHLFHLHLPRWFDGDFSLNKGIRKRAVAMSSGLVRNIETTIIKSDVVLYALVLTGIILYLLFR